MASLDDNLVEGGRLPVDPTLGAPNVDLRSVNSLPLETPVPSGPHGGPMYAPVSNRGYSLAELAQMYPQVELSNFLYTEIYDLTFRTNTYKFTIGFKEDFINQFQIDLMGYVNMSKLVRPSL